MKNPAAASSELSTALWSFRRIFYLTGVFSFCINLLLLVPALYMLQIYDRVLTSRSELTLWMSYRPPLNRGRTVFWPVND